jgi:hypothetical protein
VSAARVYTPRATKAHITDQGTITLCGLWYPEGFLGTGAQAEYEQAIDLPMCKRCLKKNKFQDLISPAHNERFPIGTPVRYWPGIKAGDGAESVTTTPVFLVGGTICVTVKDYPGGIALTHIELRNP